MHIICSMTTFKFNYSNSPEVMSNANETANRCSRELNNKQICDGKSECTYKRCVHKFILG